MAAGRPREFDIDQALERALAVFWKKGYEGATLPDLTSAMRINRPSLYAAFGNKEALFRRAVERYLAGPAAYFAVALQAPTARHVVEQLLNGAINAVTGPHNPRGCLMVQGALACGDAAEEVRQEVSDRRAGGVRALARRFQRAIAEGDLPPETSAGDLARYVATIIHGMSVQAASGASRAQLRRVARLALRNWPMP
ncbi:MAG: TetR/AcrR family transcriptional regulator [Planctomycetaceae bacterium]|nr:TetR/AcrR family transcriptional regulator [Planctomycetaceae bacterium]